MLTFARKNYIINPRLSKEVIFMPTEAYGNFLVQALLFALLAAVLLISVISLFIKPAKRTIRASLVEASSGHIIDISQAETSIGRAKACDVVIEDISVSRFHAVLSKRKSGWMIFDTNSTPGVMVNGKKIEKKSLLQDGDTIHFGDTEYVFYSTAVTTRQKIVPKTRKPAQDERPKYRKPRSTPEDRNIYRDPKRAAGGNTDNYEKPAKTRRYEQSE